MDNYKHQLVAFQPHTVVDYAEKALKELEKQLSALNESLVIKFPFSVQQRLTGTMLTNCEYDKDGLLEKVTLTNVEQGKRIVFTRTECEL